MTVKDVLSNTRKNMETKKIKGIYLRSVKNGEIFQKFQSEDEIDNATLSKSTPGAIETYGRIIIDIF